jgi:desulfoferrodoxin-like iron-binding protein
MRNETPPDAELNPEPRTLNPISKGANVSQKGEIYYCKTCGAKVKVLEGGGGILVCCGVEMELVEE